MKREIEDAATAAADELTALLQMALGASQEISQTGSIPDTLVYFAALRRKVDELEKLVDGLKAHVKYLSYEVLPTLFTNQNIKTITIPDLGRCTVNVRWNAMMPDKEEGMNWLRATGNDGLIISTVNAGTLSSFAKEMALNGMPLPEEIFRVSTAQHISITKE